MGCAVLNLKYLTDKINLLWRSVPGPVCQIRIQNVVNLGIRFSKLIGSGVKTGLASGSDFFLQICSEFTGSGSKIILASGYDLIRKKYWIQIKMVLAFRIEFLNLLNPDQKYEKIRFVTDLVQINAL